MKSLKDEFKKLRYYSKLFNETISQISHTLWTQICISDDRQIQGPIKNPPLFIFCMYRNGFVSSFALIFGSVSFPINKGDFNNQLRQQNFSG